MDISQPKANHARLEAVSGKEGGLDVDGFVVSVRVSPVGKPNSRLSLSTLLEVLKTDLEVLKTDW